MESLFLERKGKIATMNIVLIIICGIDLALQSTQINAGASYIEGQLSSIVFSFRSSEFDADLKVAHCG
jgi:hypothetical protein